MSFPGVTCYWKLPKYDTGLYNLGLCRWYPCTVNKPITWSFNNRFEAISGDEYFTDGILNFPVRIKHPNRLPTKYRTFIGYGFAYNAVMYDNNSINLRHALSRHLKKKTPEPYELFLGPPDLFDDILEVNKSEFYTSSKSDDYANHLIREYGPYDDVEDLREASIRLSQVTHPKRKLRESAVKDLQNSNAWVTDVWSNHVVWKIKFLETAKPNKDPRIIVDCSVVNSLPRVSFAEGFKKHISDKQIVYNNCIFWFNSNVSPGAVADSLRKLYTSDSVISCCYYSDDAVIKIGRVCYNVDIASNDSSHSIDVFSFYERVSNMPEEHVKNLRSIILSDIWLLNPDNMKGYIDNKISRTERVVLRSKTGYLPSGLGDTTVCNCLIYPVLCMVMSDLIDNGHEPNENLVYLAGLRFGFRFTCVKCHTVEELQFLKMSPARNLSLAVPNLGMLLRYSGFCKDEIPSSIVATTYTERCKVFQTLLTYGFFSRFFYEPLIVLCPYYTSYNELPKIQLDVSWEYWNEAEQVVLTTQDVYARYQVSQYEIFEFESLVSGSTVGTMIWCSLVDKVMEADYGLSWSATETGGGFLEF